MVRGTGTLTKFNGLGDRPIAIVPAVIVTVVGLLLANGSVTINCTTYVPAASATKVGVFVCGSVSVVRLDPGLLRNDQAYVMGSFCGSEDWLPSRVTVAPINTV